MHRIYWQGASRVALLRENLEVRAQSWARDWAGSRWDGFSVSARTSAPISDSGSRKTWLLTSNDGAAMLISADDDAGCQLARSALGLAHGRDGRLAEAVGRRCVSALLESLWGGEVSPTIGTAATVAPYAFSSRQGGAGWHMEGLPGAFEVEVNGRWCSARLPQHSSSSRRKAIADLRVPVDASIELGTIELLDSLQLCVGEVLLTDVPQQPRVRLGTRSGEIRTGRIVPEHRQRTVVLD